MTQQVEAVYENGVLRPLQVVSLAESQRVKITITDVEPGRERDVQFLERVRAEVAAMEHIPTLEEVHRALSRIPGSLVPDCISERDDRA